MEFGKLEHGELTLIVTLCPQSLRKNFGQNPQRKDPSWNFGMTWMMIKFGFFLNTGERDFLTKILWWLFKIQIVFMILLIELNLILVCVWSSMVTDPESLLPWRTLSVHRLRWRHTRNAPSRGHFVSKPLVGGFGCLELVLYDIWELAWQHYKTE